MTRLYFPGAIADHGECHVVAGQAHHVIHVLRLQVGAALTLFDGRGGEYVALIKRLDKSGLTLSVAERREVNRESPLGVVLAQGISSGERMDYTVQKCVELGITAIQPLTIDRRIGIYDVLIITSSAEFCFTHFIISVPEINCKHFSFLVVLRQHMVSTGDERHS